MLALSKRRETRKRIRFLLDLLHRDMLMPNKNFLEILGIC
jgi:hypothetical protein